MEQQAELIYQNNKEWYDNNIFKVMTDNNLVEKGFNFTTLTVKPYIDSLMKVYSTGHIPGKEWPKDKF